MADNSLKGNLTEIPAWWRVLFETLYVCSNRNDWRHLYTESVTDDRISMKRWLNNIPVVLRYGIVLALGLIFLKTVEYQFFSYRFKVELYTGLIAVFFMLVGFATGLGWLNMRRHGEQDSDAPAEPLTAQERKLLGGLIDGLSNQQLADAHHVSINTVKSHLKNLYRKLDVQSRAQAVAKAKTLSLL